MFHDAAGREVVETAPDGTTQRTVYDPADMALKSIDADGNTTVFTYDADGNPTAITDGRQTALGANGKATTYSYDDADRVVTATDPLGATDVYTYDPATGQLATWTDRRGRTTEYQYDDMGRITFTGYGRSGSAAPYSYESTLTYTYDPAGRLHTLADTSPGAGTLTYGYDLLDRLTSESGPTGSIAYNYYDDDRLKSVTPSGLTATSYIYDNAGRPKTITQGSLTVGYTFDIDDELATETLPDGIVITLSHDAAGEVTNAAYAKGTTALGNLGYTYDANGRRIGVTGTLAATTLPAPASTLTYDPANRLTASGSTALAYDAAGNLANDGVSGYIWNARGQLTNVTGPQAATLGYDPAGRLRSSTVGTLTSTFRSSGVQPIAQQGSDGSSLTYLSGLGADDILATTDGTGKTRSLLPDLQGSVVATGDSSGALTASFTYSPFGDVTAPTGDTNPIRYTGLLSGPALPNGLQNNRDRFYSPVRNASSARTRAAWRAATRTCTPTATVTRSTTPTRPATTRCSASNSTTATSSAATGAGRCKPAPSSLASAERWCASSPKESTPAPTTSPTEKPTDGAHTPPWATWNPAPSGTRSASPPAWAPEDCSPKRSRRTASSRKSTPSSSADTSDPVTTCPGTPPAAMRWTGLPSRRRPDGWSRRSTTRAPAPPASAPTGAPGRDPRGGGITDARASVMPPAPTASSHQG
ncbi:hypothetical protein ACFQ9X_33505 [Catenulispora yoronensis]